jgi:hypothetical protein
MVRRFPKVGIYVSVPRPTSNRKRYCLVSRSFSAVTVPLYDLTNNWASGNSPRSILRRKKYEELTDTLSRHEPQPSRVWSQYKEMHLLAGHEQLPLEIHQAVLRKCTPSSADLRISAASRILAGGVPRKNVPRAPHLHEDRFRTIIRNIRAAGYTPTLEDYHFILEQFAAVGHYNGSMHVYSELMFLGMEPRTRTYGLCLQAIAHRLTLPCPKFRWHSLINECIKILDELLAAMLTKNIPFTSVNLDLSIRILKEACDAQGFESLLKLAYGIDLSYPDRVPLDDIDVSGEINRLPARQPFSTAALNTTIDVLGRLGDIPKLVQTFEVLTQPLPDEASAHFSSSFDEDDDFGPSIAPPSAEKYTLPHATPNTTTYILLIKHLSKAGHAIFSRHYMKQALYMDHLTHQSLRHKILDGQPLETIISPNFTVNRGTLLPVFGLANRTKNVPLMKQVVRYAKRLRWQKKCHIIFYSNIREQLRSTSDSVEREPDSPIPPQSAPPSASVSISHSNHDTQAPNPAGPLLPRSDDNLHTTENPGSSVSSPSDGKHRFPWQTENRSANKTESVFDVDLDNPSPSPPPVKYFDIDRHIKVLERDHRDIDIFYQYSEVVYSRTIARIKERLGRRVWDGKDIYLRDQNKRVFVSRQEWRKIVRFRVSPSPISMDGPVFARDTAPHLKVAPGSIASRRGFATEFIRKRELNTRPTPGSNL